MNYRRGIVLLLGLAMIISSTAEGRKRVTGENGGEIPVAFRKEFQLPGNIQVEFFMVTLEKYKKDVDQVFDYTFSETSRIAQLFNDNSTDSDIAMINANAGVAPVQVRKETLVLAQHAKDIATWSIGAFDPVAGNGTYRNLKINKKKSTVYLSKTGSTLQLKGILEGFIADLYIRAAYHANIDDAFVRVNGVVRTMGRDAWGPWGFQILGAGETTARKGMNVKIANYSAATVGGDHYTPTVNPRNGKPVEPKFYSVTVLSPQAATSQAVATSVYIAGPTEGENLINALGIKAIFAEPNGEFKKFGSWKSKR